MPEARVETTDALQDVRNALIVFMERSQSALASLRQESRQAVRWLTETQPQYWQQELRRSFDRVASCRLSYESCRMKTIAGHRSACLEEKAALQKAQRRLEYVQEQIVVTQRAGVQAAEQTNEFLSRIGPLERALDDDLPQMLAVLDRMLRAIEAYASNASPDEAPPAPLVTEVTNVELPRKIAEIAVEPPAELTSEPLHAAQLDDSSRTSRGQDVP